jgi:hypothetical protein
MTSLATLAAAARRRRDRRILASLPPVTLPNDDPTRSPDWCWTHNCHRSACPGPH